MAANKPYYSNCDAIIIAFDITDENDFERAKDIFKEVKDKAYKITIHVLVGNKSDLEHMRAVSQAEVETFATANDLAYTEVSAKTGDGVD